MKNKILKYYDFIKEELSDTPQSYIKNKLKQLQKAFNDLFEDESENDEDSEFISIEDAKKNKKSGKKLSDLGVKMDSSEISLYSQTNDSLTVKYSDDESSYTIIIFINIKEGLENGNNNFSEDDIKKIDVKFKKYLNDIDLVGETRYSVNLDRKDSEFVFSISEGESENENGENEDSGEKMTLLEFLEFLKSDFDDKYGDDSEKLLINKD
jgi:hypothetical protein